MTISRINKVLFFTIPLLLLTVLSCGPSTIPPEIRGSWITDSLTVTVRSKSEEGKYAFTTGKTWVSIHIHENNKVTGSIGELAIEDGKITPNRGLPSNMTGIIANIDCHVEGAFFQRDPVTKKSIGIWIYPFKGQLEAKMRYTSGMSHFPMAHLNFHRPEMVE